MHSDVLSGSVHLIQNVQMYIQVRFHNRGLWADTKTGGRVKIIILTEQTGPNIVVTMITALIHLLGPSENCFLFLSKYHPFIL